MDVGWLFGEMIMDEWFKNFEEELVEMDVFGYVLVMLREMDICEVIVFKM